MGTFERIRQTSPYILALFAVIFIGFMVLSNSDITTMIRRGSNPQTANIANVNGTEISYVEYENKVKEEVDATRKQQKDKDKESEVKDDQIRKSVWGQLVDNAILKQEADNAGITINDDVIADILFNNPPDYVKQGFSDKQTGFNFTIWRDIAHNPQNLTKYYKIPDEKKSEMVQNFREDLKRIENYIKNQKLQEWLQYAVNSSGSVVSPLYAKEKYMNENTKAAVKFIALSPNQLNPNDFKVSDEEIRKYYDEHKQYWPQHDQRKIKYINYPIVPNADDTTRANKKINALVTSLSTATTDSAKYSAFEFKLAELGGSTYDYKPIKDIEMSKQPILATLQPRGVAGPITLNDGIYFIRLDDKKTGKPSVKASHVLVQFTKGNAKSKDSAKAEAEKIMKKAKSGEDFAMLAKQFSKDPSAAQNSGDMGYFDETQNFVEPFKKAALAANKGDVVGPVETEFGFHVIKIFDKITEEIKYSEIKINTIISTSTKQKLKMEATSFTEQVKNGMQFDTLAKKLKKRVQETGFIDNHKPILNSQYLADMAFAENVGTVIEPLELENFGIVVAQISEGRTKGLIPLEDKKADIKDKLRKQKMLASLKEKAEMYYNKIKGYGTLESAKKADSTLNVIDVPEFKNTGFNAGMNSRDYLFTAKAMTYPMNVMNPPYKGEECFYITQVNSKTAPNESDVKKALPDYIKQLSGNMKNSNYFQWLQNLKQDVPFIDNRKDFYKNY